MPRFYFPIIDGTKLDDLEGIEFPDREEALKHADLIALHMPHTHDRNVAVVDEDGKELHRVTVQKQE